MNPIWFLRMAKWVRNPPSWARVKLVVGVVLACFVIFGVEYIWGWPDALTPQRIKP
ncbi:MAG: hypothetical protein U0934_06100 [Pseudotabrizicola sp.]|uniref:hypothetical protein n=1 Tax=Pseudotabrizicola sp. TaxID=2939647 RepID=UPI002725378A|nr:hypothetical protein [Pseudotabrizicola sp.]MDO8885012.1 hypothetical protein [Pseudotabrizicola sp.]MDP2082613.1 hypothetical protein [Pseudotabrizicola sp.]MDZ7573509.1 hypothetical protein [Pseudotabrizicola sp.]